MSALHSVVPNSRQFLALLITALASGTVLADMAGRVNFVLGDVKAISLDGTTRKLSKSDLVYSGERLETGRGRLQIRFTDGSFMSLQPDTVFRLDSYRFDKAKPEQGALQFNFLRGGLRTVTGAIGKVNRANYTVRSAVATIGIRGTGYATTLKNGVLTLTVDKGIVNLSNDFGSSNINAGQTYQVEPGEAPHLAPPGINAVALAQTPDGLGQSQDDLLAGIVDSSLSNNDVLAGELNLPDGEFSSANTLKDSFYPQGSGEPEPAYSFASRFRQANNSFLIGNVGGFFNPSTDSARGGLLQLTSTANNKVSTLFNAGDISNNGLHFNQVRTLNSLSFGEWTQGRAANGQLDASDNTITLGSNEYEPYIIGLATQFTLAMDTQGNAVKLNYRLTDATPARSTNGDTGTLSRLNLDITLSPLMLVDVDMQVDMNQSGRYSVNRSGIAVNNGSDNRSAGFQLEGRDLRATGQNCASTGCPVTLAALFAGETELGALYSIDRADNSQIGGVGALTRSSANNVAIKLANNDSPTYRAVFVDNASHTLHQENSINSQFASDGSLQSAVVNSGNMYGSTQPANSNTTKTREAAHAAQTLAWGRWHSGDIAYGDSTITLNSDGLHYLVGTPTAGNFPTTQLSYSFVGGTNPTAATSGGSLLATGQVQSGTVNINFGQQSATLALGLGFGNTGINVSGNGSFNSGNLSFGNLAVGVSTNNSTPVSCSNCNASASGFVAGANAEMVGLGYQVRGVTLEQNSNVSISGVGVFANKH